MKAVAGASGAQAKANGGSGAKAVEKAATENAVKAVSYTHLTLPTKRIV